MSRRLTVLISIITTEAYERPFRYQSIMIVHTYPR